MRLLADWTTGGSKTSTRRSRKLSRISAPIKSVRKKKRARTPTALWSISIYGNRARRSSAHPALGASTIVWRWCWQTSLEGEVSSLKLPHPPSSMTPLRPYACAFSKTSRQHEVTLQSGSFPARRHRPRSLSASWETPQVKSTKRPAATFRRGHLQPQGRRLRKAPFVSTAGNNRHHPQFRLWIFMLGTSIMQQSANPSLGELKRETEQTRAGLTQTVEQLRTSVSETASDIRQRLSPESIKAGVSDYVRSRGERLVEDVPAAARRNPMQAVAVGAGIAYPLLKLARAIPMPVLLVGAGLFFAGSKTGQSAVQKASDVASEFSDEVSRRGHDLSDQVGASVAAARDAAIDAVGRAGEMMSTGVDRLRDSAGSVLNAQSDTVRDSAASLADTVSAKGRDLKGSVLDLAGSASERIRGIASDSSDAVQGTLVSTRDTAVETARILRNTASVASDRAGRTVFETIERNPLLVAGVGLLLGGLIASALPRSDLEDNLVGEASEAAKNRARDAASRGFDVAKDAAGEIFENVARQAGTEGLTSEGLDTAAKDIGQRVRRVAEAAVTTAFEPDNASTTSSAGGGEHHG